MVGIVISDEHLQLSAGSCMQVEAARMVNCLVHVCAEQLLETEAKP
jgi:hypothetical protein